MIHTVLLSELITPPLLSLQMDLQTIFYIVGIICMSLYTLLFVTIIVLLFFVYKKVTAVYENVEKKFAVAKEIVNHPKEAIATVGAVVAETALQELAEMKKSKRKK